MGSPFYLLSRWNGEANDRLASSGHEEGVRVTVNGVVDNWYGVRPSSNGTISYDASALDFMATISTPA